VITLNNVSGADGLVKLWTVKSNECVATYDNHEDKVLLDPFLYSSFLRFFFKACLVGREDYFKPLFSSIFLEGEEGEWSKIPPKYFGSPPISGRI